MSQLIMTEDLRRGIQSMMTSEPWKVYKEFMENQQKLHSEKADQALNASLTSILEREQFIGAAKFSKLDMIDFHNFVTTQTHRD